MEPLDFSSIMVKNGCFKHYVSSKEITRIEIGVNHFIHPRILLKIEKKFMENSCFKYYIYLLNVWTIRKNCSKRNSCRHILIDGKFNILTMRFH